jgi:hypothetical protein
MFSIVRGLGVGALVTAGYGFGLAPVPPGPGGAIPNRYDTGGGGVSLVEIVDQAPHAPPPPPPPAGSYWPKAATSGPAAEARARLPITGSNGLTDLGRMEVSWDPHDNLFTGPLADAGVVHARWEDALGLTSGGAVDTGLVHESWASAEKSDKLKP